MPSHLWAVFCLLNHPLHKHLTYKQNIVLQKLYNSQQKKLIDEYDFSLTLFL